MALKKLREKLKELFSSNAQLLDENSPNSMSAANKDQSIKMSFGGKGGSENPESKKSSFKGPLSFHNTLSKKKEVFKPLMPGRAGLYNCGPTVYNYVTIGNLRSYVFADTLRRVLEFNGYKVKQVINITDVGHLASDADEGEDKMTKALRREHKPLTLEAMKEVALFYEQKFKDDLVALNIDTKHIVFPRASETIDEQIAIIEELERKNYTYKTSDGVYFDTSKFKGYGKLGQTPTDEKNAETDAHARIATNPEKRHQQDFALWKFDANLGWESPWGMGFPGWHIECSAMAMSNLGATIDLHTGGIDHISIHHNNEIAQSEAATGKQFVRYWLHNEFIRLQGEKMAKSSATGFLRLADLNEKGISPLAYRYWLLGASYRSPIDFSFEALKASASAYHKLITQVSRLKKHLEESTIEPETVDFKSMEQFKAAVNDDLNTPAALSILWKLLSDSSVSPKDKLATIIEFDRVLGLDIDKQSNLLLVQQEKDEDEVPADVLALAEKREQSRRKKEWKKADELRGKIEKKGYSVKDTVDGFELRKLE